jgi:hypothetical protein
MRLVKAVADCTMMVAGYEHQTLECGSCRTVERRMVFGRTIGPLTVEPMRLASSSPAPAAAPEQSAPIDHPKAWSRALGRLRNTQSALKERAAAALASEAIQEFRRTWDGLTRSAPNARQNGSAAISISAEIAPAKSPMPAHTPVGRTAASTQAIEESPAAHQSAVAHAAATLRQRQPAMASVRFDPLAQGQSFDEIWEGLAVNPRPPAPAVKPFAPRPRPLHKSRSLVPVEAHPEMASSPWARAVAMLRSQQG